MASRSLVRLCTSVSKVSKKLRGKGVIDERMDVSVVIVFAKYLKGGIAAQADNIEASNDRNPGMGIKPINRP